MIHAARHGWLLSWQSTGGLLFLALKRHCAHQQLAQFCWSLLTLSGVTKQLTPPGYEGKYIGPYPSSASCCVSDVPPPAAINHNSFHTSVSFCGYLNYSVYCCDVILARIGYNLSTSQLEQLS